MTRTIQPNQGLRRSDGLRRLALASALASCLGLGAAQASELYAEDGLVVRWDNDLTYSAGFRLNGVNTTMLAYPNSDDADRNFNRGLMLSRFELASSLDLTTDRFGAHLSALAWYDSVYSSGTDNNSDATYNMLSVPAGKFSHAVRALDGSHVELGENFLYANLALGEMPLSVRLGRQSLLWGESLFFADNSIAAGQAPLDYIRGTLSPQGYSRQVFLPVNQLSMTLQPSAELSISAYYQLEWRASRLPAVGSYFSANDVTGPGTERAFLAQGLYLLHVPDEKPPSDGQFGIAFHQRVEDIDIGLYALRFNAKYPVIEASLLPQRVSALAGTFQSIYPAGIWLYGASFSTYLWDYTIAGEISARHNMPLISTLPVSLTFPAGPRQTNYAEGDSLHGQLSAISTLAPSFLWDSADLNLEIAANDRLAVTRNAIYLNPSRSRFALSARVLFQPHYFQVAPNLDVTPLLAAGFNMIGRSSVDYSQNAGSGDFEFGVSAVYRATWRADMTLTTFAGAPYRQALTDRGFLMVRLGRSF